jgi:hypothetical protein
VAGKRIFWTKKVGEFAVSFQPTVLEDGDKIVVAGKLDGEFWLDGAFEAIAGNGLLVLRFDQDGKRISSQRFTMSPKGTQPPTGPKLLASPPCVHDICLAGVKLVASCSPCVGAICASDTYCCGTAWDAICASEVSSICGWDCGPCAHSPCVEGSPLKPYGCMSVFGNSVGNAVNNVSAPDNYCAYTAWDGQCVTEYQQSGVTCP